VVQTKIFKSNQSQAVRLPKAVAFPDPIKKVTIIAIGNTRVIAPAEQSWDDWFDAPAVSDEFMQDRQQSRPQKRESMDG
jgi:antitoxin VapB